MNGQNRCCPFCRQRVPVDRAQGFIPRECEGAASTADAAEQLVRPAVDAGAIGAVSAADATGAANVADAADAADTMGGSSAAGAAAAAVTAAAGTAAAPVISDAAAAGATDAAGATATSRAAAADAGAAPPELVIGASMRKNFTGYGWYDGRITALGEDDCAKGAAGYYTVRLYAVCSKQARLQ